MLVPNLVDLQLDIDMKIIYVFYEHGSHFLNVTWRHLLIDILPPQKMIYVIHSLSEF